MGEDILHKPVLLNEVVGYLQPSDKSRYVDCTLGAGGHAKAILAASSPDGLLLGIDVDEDAIKIAKENLREYQHRVTIVRESYIHLHEILSSIGWQEVDGILIDLGVSSMQLDQAEKGFSFQQEGRLDMRFDRKNPLTAEEIVNEYSEKKLADIIYTYGEERYSRQIARAIIKSRPLRTTLQLAEVIKKAIPHSNNSIHPATRTFQALRIAVNNELEAIEKVLPQSLHSLCVGGKLAVISFHSLEDRIVKQYFQKESKDCICPPKQPVCTCGHKASIKWVTRHFISPSEQEKLENPRSRSAKLRVVEKVA